MQEKLGGHSKSQEQLGQNSHGVQSMLAGTRDPGKAATPASLNPRPGKWERKGDGCPLEENISLTGGGRKPWNPEEEAN